MKHTKAREIASERGYEDGGWWGREILEYILNLKII